VQFLGNMRGQTVVAAVQIKGPDRVPGIVLHPAVIMYNKRRAEKKRHIASKETELRCCRSEHSCGVVTVRNTAYAGKENRNALLRTY
jgi:hypothetical protein